MNFLQSIKSNSQKRADNPTARQYFTTTCIIEKLITGKYANYLVRGEDGALTQADSSKLTKEQKDAWDKELIIPVAYVSALLIEDGKLSSVSMKGTVAESRLFDFQLLPAGSSATDMKCTIEYRDITHKYDGAYHTAGEKGIAINSLTLLKDTSNPAILATIVSRNGGSWSVPSTSLRLLVLVDIVLATQQGHIHTLRNVSKYITDMTLPVITLSNGLRVANYGSPHPFTFTDGTILPAAEDERAKTTMLKPIEIVTEQVKNGVTIYNIKLDFEIPKEMYDEMITLYNSFEYDIILIPLPLMLALKKRLTDEVMNSDEDIDKPIEDYVDESISFTPFRCIRVADRITKAIYLNRFCV